MKLIDLLKRMYLAESVVIYSDDATPGNLVYDGLVEKIPYYLLSSNVHRILSMLGEEKIMIIVKEYKETWHY